MGTHINCVGTDTKGKREIPLELIAQANYFVDDAHQARELGELQWSPATSCIEIGDILLDGKNHEYSSSEIM